MRSTACYIFLIFTNVLWADGPTDEQLDSTAVAKLEEVAKEIVQAKCGKCHNEKSDINPFTEKGSPYFAEPQEASERLEMEGESRMPPKGQPQLTPAQIAILQAWLKLQIEKASDKGRVKKDCRDLRRSPILDNQAQSLLKNACVQCHGEHLAQTLDWPWEVLEKTEENVVRSLHTTFLRENGTLDLGQLGEVSVDTYPPEGYTSIKRLLNQTSQHYMPPRKTPPGFSVSNLSDEDRKNLVAWLVFKNDLRTCSIENESVLLSERKMNFSQTAKWCEEQGGWIPTSPQVYDWLEERKLTESCFWTSSFSSVRSGKIRLIYEREEDRKNKGKFLWQSYRVNSAYTCFGICVAERQRDK